jgi:AraC family transcriptional regulator of adaptative response / DNA-3-methyladenine glycosylase II
MASGLNRATRYHAVLERDKKYDGIFYFAAKNTGVYCRPSCTALRTLQDDYSFFITVEEAKLHGYKACAHCHPDRLKNGLSLEILDNIDAGAINDKGVHGLADSLHISERHLRRIVQDRTGSSPHSLNKTKRLTLAKLLITQTKLPITDIAFSAEFSSLRQFNDVFKDTFNVTPREMRKAVH